MATITAGWDAPSKHFLGQRVLARTLVSVAKKAGRDGVRALRADVKRQTRQRVRIRAGYLADQALPLKYARGDTLAGLEWRMDVSGKEVPLGEYPKRQTRRGVSIEIQRGKRVVLESAFVARGRGARMGVFKRPSKAPYPMGHRVGLRASDAMQDGQIPRLALQRAGWVFARTVERLLRHELNSQG